MKKFSLKQLCCVIEFNWIIHRGAKGELLILQLNFYFSFSRLETLFYLFQVSSAQAFHMRKICNDRET